MSINSCTTDSENVNSIGRDRRAAIIATLQMKLPQGGHHPQHVNPNTRQNFNIFRRDVDREDSVETETLELPQIAVTITLDGESFVQTLDRGDDQFRPMINVYGLSLREMIDPIPIIYGLTIRNVVDESVNITIDNIRTL